LPRLQLTDHWSPWLPSFNQLLYTPPALYDQLTNFFLIVHCSPLNLAKDPSATLHPQSGMICLLIQDYRSPPPQIPLSAVSRQSSSHSIPVLPTYSDCRRLRFSVITADFCAPYKLLYYYCYYRRTTTKEPVWSDVYVSTVESRGVTCVCDAYVKMTPATIIVEPSTCLDKLRATSHRSSRRQVRSTGTP